MRRPRQTLAAALLLPLLVGCGGAPQASDPPTADQPASTATPSAEAAPTRPPAAQKRNQSGAKAAVQWFLSSMTYAGLTGDTRTFRDTFSKSCTRCAAIADGIEQTYEAGGRIDGGGWVPFDYRYYGIRDDVALIDAYVNYSPQVYVEREGASPTRFPARKNVLKAFQLTWSDGWVVGALDPEA